MNLSVVRIPLFEFQLPISELSLSTPASKYFSSLLNSKCLFELWIFIILRIVWNLTGSLIQSHYRIAALISEWKSWIFPSTTDHGLVGSAIPAANTSCWCRVLLFRACRRSQFPEPLFVLQCRKKSKQIESDWGRTVLSSDNPLTCHTESNWSVGRAF